MQLSSDVARDIAAARKANAEDDDIITRVEDFLNRFIAFPDPAQARVLALWVLHTHTFAAAYATPYIYVTSAEPGSGKTRVIEVLELLAHDAKNTSRMTASAMYRIMESRIPTMLIDEVDAVFSGSANENLRGVINSGYKRGGSVALTMPGKADPETGSDVVDFPTFCPKLFAGLDNGQVPPTIADRCIRIVLKKKRKDQTIERFNPRDVEPEAEALKADIRKWAIRNVEGVMAWRPDWSDDIGDRQNEIAEPLLAVAMQAGGNHPDAARTAVVHLLSGGEKVMTPGAQCLKAARDIMDANEADHIASAALAEALSMNGKLLGARLAPYGIKPTTLTRGGQRFKGYSRADFTDAWERYL